MKVLYAEDEVQLSSAVTEILKLEGFEVTSVYDGAQAWQAIQSGYFDAIVLDIMMPEMDGIEVLKKTRACGNHTPVLMLTAKTALDDRLDGLGSGADDYLGKPFAIKELVARLNSLIRRTTGYKSESLSIANITLDSSSCELKSDKGSLRLSNAEVEVLSHFIKNRGKFSSAEEINQIIWSGKESAEKAELYIFYLKNKLRQIHSDVNIIEEGGAFALGG